jgi:hypothetical protein
MELHVLLIGQLALVQPRAAREVTPLPAVETVRHNQESDALTRSGVIGSSRIRRPVA